MSRFSATLMEHFQEPRNRGPMLAPDIVGVAGLSDQGRFMIFYMRVRDNRVVDASFTCNGCGVTIACGSALVEATIGRTLAECRSIGTTDLMRILDGIPSDVMDRAAFAVASLHNGLARLVEPTDGDPGRPPS